MRENIKGVDREINYSKIDGTLFGEPENRISKSIEEYPQDSIRYLGVGFESCRKDWVSLIEIYIYQKEAIIEATPIRLWQGSIWNQFMISTLVHNMKDLCVDQETTSKLKKKYPKFITTICQFKIKILIKPPTEGVLDSSRPGRFKSHRYRCLNDMFMHPKDIWQYRMQRLIEKLCPNFKTQLQQ
eukprot:34530_4